MYEALNAVCITSTNKKPSKNSICFSYLHFGYVSLLQQLYYKNTSEGLIWLYHEWKSFTCVQIYKYQVASSLIFIDLIQFDEANRIDAT